MSKRKMVQSNLVKNSIAAYFAAIEIHNKPIELSDLEKAKEMKRSNW